MTRNRLQIGIGRRRRQPSFAGGQLGFAAPPATQLEVTQSIRRVCTLDAISGMQRMQGQFASPGGAP